MNRQVRLARARLATTNDPALLKKKLATEQAITTVMDTLWMYRFRKGCMMWCLIVGTIPIFLLLGMISPLGPGWYVVWTEFAYWPEFLFVICGAYLLAILADWGL